MGFDEDFVGRGKGFFSWLGSHYYGFPFVGYFIRFSHFKKATSSLRFKNALDAGCGMGKYAFFLSEKNPQAHINAFDIYRPHIEKLSVLASQRGFSNLNFFFADMARLKINKQYDFVFSVDSLEHVKNNKAVIKKLCGLVKKSGWLFVHMPAKQARFRFFPAKIFKKYSLFERQEHVGETYSLEEFTKLIQGYNMKAVKKANTFGFFGEFAWELDRVFQEKKLALLRALLLPFVKAIGYLDTIAPNKSGNGFFVLAQKA